MQTSRGWHTRCSGLLITVSLLLMPAAVRGNTSWMRRSVGEGSVLNGVGATLLSPWYNWFMVGRKVESNMVKVTRILIEVSVAEVDSDEEARSLANVAINRIHNEFAGMRVNTLDTHLSIAEETFDDEGEGPIEPLRMVQSSPAGEGMVQDSLQGGMVDFSGGEVASLERTNTCSVTSVLVRPLARFSHSSRTVLRVSTRFVSSLLPRAGRSGGVTPTSCPGARVRMGRQSRSLPRDLFRKLARDGMVQRSGV